VKFSLGELQTRLGGRIHPDARATVVDRLVVDSRQGVPGALFVALPGTRTHGRRFAADASAAGAAVLVAPPAPEGVDPTRLWLHDHPLATVGELGRLALARTGARVVGITGSVGKSATRAMVETLLAGRFRVGATPGNQNTAIGLPMALVSQPEALDWFVAEMGMRGPGEIRRLTEIARPVVSVITNIGYAHVGQLGSLEAVAAAKAEILVGLDRSGVAVLNRQDARVAALAKHTAARTVWFGGSEADVEAYAVEAYPGGIAFQLRVDSAARSVHMAWEGAHQADNAAAAAAVAWTVGIPIDEIAARLELVPAGASHFRRRRGRGFTILDDTYNASPASVGAGLRVLAGEVGRRVAVLGDMMELGDAEEALHREMGVRAADSADVVLTVGPRGRWAAEAAAQAGARVEAFDTVAELEGALARELLPGDVVYLKASRAMGLDAVADRLAEGAP
jgi:UDP-N-acetylmuramoyl-tripeptide--D-alanyl-D-alanine ligase